MGDGVLWPLGATQAPTSPYMGLAQDPVWVPDPCAQTLYGSCGLPDAPLPAASASPATLSLPPEPRGGGKDRTLQRCHSATNPKTGSLGRRAGGSGGRGCWRGAKGAGGLGGDTRVFFRRL